MTVDRASIRQQLLDGKGPDAIAKGNRAVHHAVLEEQARLEEELGTIEPSARNVVRLRDDRRLRWEAIAVRIYGSVRDVATVKALYDELKGPGAHRRSYTGRGRRFAGMTDDPRELAPAEERGWSAQEATDVLIGVERETAVSPQRLREIDVLRTGTTDQIRAYLEHHLHSDRFYIDDNSIWLELPQRDRALLVWYVIPDSYSVAGPTAGTRAGLHAFPRDWNATLCHIPVNSWGSGIAIYNDAEVGCRWCEIRLIAIEVASGKLPERTEPNPRPRRPLAAPGTARSWDEGSFLAEAERIIGEKDAAVARHLIEWAKTTFGGIEWGTADGGRFTPTIRHGGHSYGPVHIWTTGRVAFQFSPMSQWPPFDDEALRLELLHRLNQIEAVDLPESGISGKPHTTLSAFRDPTKLETLCRELEWWASQIQSVRNG
jgi:hypothetical protein